MLWMQMLANFICHGSRIKITFGKNIFLHLVGSWNGKLVEKSTNERVEIRWVDGVEMWIDGKLDSDTMVFGRFKRTSAHIARRMKSSCTVELCVYRKTVKSVVYARLSCVARGKKDAQPSRRRRRSYRCGVAEVNAM